MSNHGIDEEPELIDLTQGGIDLSRIQLAQINAASSVALRLVSYFGWVLLALFAGGLLVLLAGVLLDILSLPGGSPQQHSAQIGLLATPKLVSAYTEIIKSVSVFASTLFGPMLGFILGHYFGQKGG